MSLRTRTVLAAALLAAPAALFAQTYQVVVTTPAGAGTTNDPVVADAWLRANVRTGGAVGVTTDYARAGNGSAYFSSANGGAKADLELYLNPALVPYAKLSLLQSVGFDFLRDASSTVAGHLMPGFRLMVDADGNVATTTDRGYLIYESVYNGGGEVAENAWQRATIGSTTNLWWRQFGAGTEEVFNRTLGQYQTGAYTPTGGFAKLSGNSIVYGLSMGVGSGWDGTYEGAIDNVMITSKVRAGGYDAVNFNFESAQVVPEPSTYVLMGSGLLGLAGIAARRRRQG